MNVTTLQFDIVAWRGRMQWTQQQAAKALGLSHSAYRALEYRNQDRAGAPCGATAAKLAHEYEKQKAAGTLDEQAVFA